MREGEYFAAGALLGLALMAPGPAAAIDPQDFSQVERGRYLAVVGDCGACHDSPTGQKFAGGRSIETPFGVLLGPNITPDLATGVGAWSDEEFVNALTKGTGHNGERLYPAMPYPYMTKLTEADALAIRSYFDTVLPVRNEVHSNQLPFPFDIRAGMDAWNQLYFTPGPFRPVAGKSAAWNRGAYLVEGLGHCGACHTPKSFAGGDDTAKRLQGYALQGWFAPDITNSNRRGLGSWSVDEIVSYLKTGRNATAAATGLMAEVIMDSTSKMTEADLRGMAEYLKDQPARPETAEAKAPDSGVMNRGGAIYADECSACHAPMGTGIAGMFPSLKGSPGVQSVDPTSLLHVVLRGARSAATDQAPGAPAMPAFGRLLTDEEVAAVVTYVRNAWGNSAPTVDAASVAKTRSALASRTD